MKNPIWIELVGLSQHWGKMLIWSRRHHPETSASPSLPPLLPQQIYFLGSPATCAVLGHLSIFHPICQLCNVMMVFILTVTLIQSYLAFFFELLQQLQQLLGIWWL